VCLCVCLGWRFVRRGGQISWGLYLLSVCVCLSVCVSIYVCACVCVWDGGLPDKVDNYHRCRTCCMSVFVSMCLSVRSVSIYVSVCVCVCLGWRFAGRGRQLSRVVPAGAAADGPVGPQVDNVRLHDVCLQSRQRARRSHLLSTQNSRSVEFTHLTLALTHTLALYHHHRYHHFMCPIIQQCAHLHQCSLEEQDSKVRQEH